METKKMTQKDAQEFVKNTKYIVFNEDESKQLQEKLFEIGCGWFTLKKETQTSIGPFLYVNEKMEMTMSDKEHYIYFEESSKKYMPTSSILNIELEQEPIKEPKPKFDPNTLKPFDRVLVRDNVNNVWKARFFDRYCCKQLLTTDGLVYIYCIPYNEETKHLHGTNEDEPEFYKLD